MLPPDLDVLQHIGFRQLSQGVFFYTPFGTLTHSDFCSSQTRKDPNLIVLCAWGFAHGKHIAKYVAGHRSLFPGSDILLVRNCIGNVMWKRNSSQMPWFFPAADVLRKYVNPKSDTKILFHIFSNAGSHSAVQLSEACRRSDPSFAIPVTSIVFDSCPSMPIFKPMVSALSLGTPSKSIFILAMTKFVAFVIVAISIAFEKMHISRSASTKLYTALNDPKEGFLILLSWAKDKFPIPRPIPRAYTVSSRLLYNGLWYNRAYCTLFAWMDPLL